MATTLELGQTVALRGRPYFVENAPFKLYWKVSQTEQHLVSLFCLDENALDELLSVVWEPEPGAEAREVLSVRILLRTDAALEVIKLKNHCSRPIHYEIPWNPSRLEQRNGCVDRHGQHAPTVDISHFVAVGLYLDSGGRHSVRRSRISPSCSPQGRKYPVGSRQGRFYHHRACEKVHACR